MVSEVFELGEEIPAPASLVFRLLSETERFPDICPELCRVEILWRSGPRTLSRWELQADGIHLSWLQQDLLDQGGRRISCRLIGLNGAGIKGEWRVWELSECSSAVTGHFSLRLAPGEEMLGRKVCWSLRRLLAAIRRRLEVAG